MKTCPVPVKIPLTEPVVKIASGMQQSFVFYPDVLFIHSFKIPFVFFV